MQRIQEEIGGRRIILTADRGFAAVETFRLLKQEQVAFVIRVKCSVLIKLKGVWASLRTIEQEADGEKRKPGKVKYCKSDEESLEVTVSCVKATDEGKDRWYLASNMKRPAFFFVG